MKPSVFSSRRQGRIPEGRAPDCGAPEGRAPDCGAPEGEDDWLFLSSDSAGPRVPESTRDQQETEDRGRLRSKLVSAWNSMKYASGWSVKQKSRLSRSSPVVLLGQSFDLKDPAECERFHVSLVSVLWFTYRRGFPALPGCSLTTDSGWGCVLRSAQMMLAQGLLLHLMPPGWTWSVRHHVVKDDMDLERRRGNGEAGPQEVPPPRGRKLSAGSVLDRPLEASHRRVVSWFWDRPPAPFGIHRLVELGESSGKRGGDWYGPSMAAHILQKAVSSSPDVPALEVYVAQDCTVYLEDVRRLCERPPPQPWKSVMVLVPVRLGGHNLNPAYITCVKKLLTLPCCIGIIGGKPKHSLYFIGFQDDYLLYLDPHYCQSTVDVTQVNFPLESFHCKHPRKMSVSRMDPSCTIGFYAKGQSELERVRHLVTEALSTSSETYPMFTFSEGQSQGAEPEATPTNHLTYIQRSQRRRVDTCSSLDEFVLL